MMKSLKVLIHDEISQSMQVDHSVDGNGQQVCWKQIENVK